LILPIRIANTQKSKILVLNMEALFLLVMIYLLGSTLVGESRFTPVDIQK